MKLVVLSHHQIGGGKPLDSFWFSREECSRQGIQLRFLWTKQISNFLNFIPSEQIVFDGAASLVSFHGYKFYALSQLLGMRTAIYWHETEWGVEKAIKRQPDWYRVVQKALCNPKIVHFHVCSYGLRMLQERYGVKPKNLYLLHNISEPTRLLRYQLPLSSEPNLVVACGLVGEKKGVDLFLDMAERVISQKVEAKFVWIGSYGEGHFSQKAIAKAVFQRGLEEKVVFTGAMSNPTKIIAKARIFLLTSRDDPMPKVLMEALALGKPCIAFGVGGVSELLGQFGTIIPPNNVEAFTQAVIEQLQAEDENGSAQYRRRQRYLQQYSPDAFAERFAKAVEWWEERSKELLD